MPSRVVRGEILTSRSLARVSELAEAMFARLLNLVDDYGRYDGDAEILAAHLYPRRRSVIPEMIETRLQELASADGPGKGPILLYEVEGRRYLQLVNWECHRGKSKRAARSRWPARPDCAEPQGSQDAQDPQDLNGEPRESAGILGPPPGVARCRGVEVKNQTPLPAEPADIPGGENTEAKTRAPPIPSRWVDAVARINAVFRLYDGPKIRRIGPPRGKRFAVIDRDYGPLAEIASKAIHGYVCRHGTKDRDDFAARKYFELDSILAPSHLDANLQACEDAIDRGHSKPFKRGDHTRRAKPRHEASPREPPESPAVVARQVSESLKQASETA